MRISTIAILALGWLTVGSAHAQPTADEMLRDCGVQSGVIVHVGCGDGDWTATLACNESCLVQGLDCEASHVAKARAHADSLGLDGRISFDQFDGRRLPYVDNLVNLVIIGEPTGDKCSSALSTEEVMRVLRPGGVACTLHGATWETTRKPWPDDIDQWTHYLHGPDNNAVAKDTVVGPPRHFQWISRPRFSRSHDHLASVSAVVTAHGRLFSIVDEGSIAFAAAQPKWRLVAQDAFNGVRLWEREISRWEYHLRDFRSGPADIARRLVAVGDRVYVTLGYGEPVVALDAVSGKTIHTYAGTEGAREIIFYDGALLTVCGGENHKWKSAQAKQIVTQKDYAPPFERYSPPAHDTRVVAVEAATGNTLWQCSEPAAREIMPSTLAASMGRVFFQNAEAVVCLDAATGKVQWQTPRPVHRHRLAWSTPTLVVHDGVVLSADRRAEQPDGELLWIPSGGYHEYLRGEGIEGKLIAMDARTGEALWSCPAYEGFNSPVDVLVADGLVWTGRYAWGNDPGITQGRDLKTGKVVRRRPSDLESLPRIGHARCHRAKATSNYLIVGRRGIELIDLQTGHMVANFWVRGICQYGILPANGLIYAPPHACACWVTDLLKCGFMALAPQRPNAAGTRPERGPTRQEGPAYDRVANASPTTEATQWPTYRGNAARSGGTAGQLAESLQLKWSTDLGAPLTAPVVAAGRVLVARRAAHRLCALDVATGRPLWSFATSGPIDSPPTVDGGRVLFGSADGWVYCVRLDSGELIWRFRAAPCEKRIVVDGQLESPWPVSGSVLVLDGTVYFSAGRTSYLDGGMWLCKLDATTGKPLKIEPLEVEQEKRDSGSASGGYLPDVLASDGQSIFMRQARFDLQLQPQKANVPHLWSSVGFLDDSWWHRTYWQYGTSMRSGWGGWPKAAQQAPAGRLLVTDGQRIFGFGRSQYDIPGAHVGVDASGVWGPIGPGRDRWTFYRLFGTTLPPSADPTSQRRGQEANLSMPSEPDWSRQISLMAKAMVLADDSLLLAGAAVDAEEVPKTPKAADPLADALERDRSGRLLLVSTEDGKTRSECALPGPPVFDGMAVANGRVFLSTTKGTVVCLGPDE